MKLRKILKNNQGAGYLSAVVMLIAVLMATIIGAVVFFAFAGGVDNTITDSYTEAISGSADIWIPLTSQAGSTPAFVVERTNATGVVSTITAGATGYEYIAGNNTIRVDAIPLGAGDTLVTIEYYTQSHDTQSTVVGYAVTVFALLAIVPLVMVGGLMLRSLGFMGGGSEI